MREILRRHDEQQQFWDSKGRLDAETTLTQYHMDMAVVTALLEPNFFYSTMQALGAAVCFGISFMGVYNSMKRSDYLVTVGLFLSLLPFLGGFFLLLSIAGLFP